MKDIIEIEDISESSTEEGARAYRARVVSSRLTQYLFSVADSATGIARFSVPQMSTALELPKSTIIRALDRLESFGSLVRIHDGVIINLSSPDTSNATNDKLFSEALANRPYIHRSQGEIEVEKFLRQHDIAFITEYAFEGALRNPDTGRPLRVDFYLPDHSLVIEFDGIHHTTSSSTARRDKIKEDFLSANGICLIVLPYSALGRVSNFLTFLIRRKND